MSNNNATEPQLPPTMILGLTLPKLSLGIYAVGYFAYLIPALIWGWNAGVQPFLGFALWQALLYGTLWPLIVLLQFYRIVIGML